MNERLCMDCGRPVVYRHVDERLDDHTPHVAVDRWPPKSVPIGEPETWHAHGGRGWHGHPKGAPETHDEGDAS